MDEAEKRFLAETADAKHTFETIRMSVDARRKARIQKIYDQYNDEIHSVKGAILRATSKHEYFELQERLHSILDEVSAKVHLIEQDYERELAPAKTELNKVWAPAQTRLWESRNGRRK